MLLNEKMGMGPKARRETMVDYLKLLRPIHRNRFSIYINPNSKCPSGKYSNNIFCSHDAADNQLMVKVVSSDEKHQGDIQSIH